MSCSYIYIYMRPADCSTKPFSDSQNQPVVVWLTKTCSELWAASPLSRGVSLTQASPRNASPCIHLHTSLGVRFTASQDINQLGINHRKHYRTQGRTSIENWSAKAGPFLDNIRFWLLCGGPKPLRRRVAEVWSCQPMLGSQGFPDVHARFSAGLASFHIWFLRKYFGVDLGGQVPSQVAFGSI